MATSIITKGTDVDETLLTPVKVRWYDDNTDLFFQKQIGDFQVNSKLGSGRYGVVKAGEDTKRHIQVAIKLIAKDNLTDIEKYSIKQEAQIMNFLAHTNIIQLYEVIENKQYICMVMEFAAGGELFDYVTRQTRLQEVEARKLFMQILDGLGYCHANQIIHRDIKAENIFLDEKLEKIKIGDWGFATVYQAGATLETSCGSLEYAAPEILSGKPHLGPEVDVWALGVLLYFMVCGYLPFRAATDFDVFTKIKRGQYRTLPGHISEELKNLIEIVFNIDHNSRPSINHILIHQWSKKADADPNYLKRPKLPRLLQLQIRQYSRNKSDPQFMSPRTDTDSDIASAFTDTESDLNYAYDFSDLDLHKKSVTPTSLSSLSPAHKKSSSMDIGDSPTSGGKSTEASPNSSGTPQKRRSLKRGLAANKIPGRLASAEEIDPMKKVEMDNDAKYKAIAEAAAERPRAQQLKNKTSRSKSQSMRPAIRKKDINGEGEPKKKTLRRRRKDSNARIKPSSVKYFDEGDEEGLETHEPQPEPNPPPNPNPNPISTSTPALPPSNLATSATDNSGISATTPVEPSQKVEENTVSVPPLPEPELNQEGPPTLNSASEPVPVVRPSSQNGHVSSSSNQPPQSQQARSRSPSGSVSMALSNELEQQGSETSGRAAPTRSDSANAKRRSKPEALIFPPRPKIKIQNSNFSVLHVDSQGLGKIKSSDELAILSIENEENHFVVVVSARSEKGQEAKIVELMKKFEQNASKLKRSKSLENIFADVVSSAPATEDGDNARKLLGPRRTLTWDVRSNKPGDPKVTTRITRQASDPTVLPSALPQISEISGTNLRRCVSAPGSNPTDTIQEHPTEGSQTLSIPEEEPVKLSPKKQHKKKHKKMKVKMFRPSNPVNNIKENDNNHPPPVVVSSPEEEILGFS